MKAIFKAYERNAALILASEKWAKGYDQAPEQHGKLIKTAARLERKILVFFKDLSNQTNIVNWNTYRYALYEVKASKVDAYDVQVIVDSQAIEDQNEPFISIVFAEVAVATALGAQAGEVTYNIPLGLGKADAEIQRLAREQVGRLVSKEIDVNGKLVDSNTPDAFKISDKTIKDIQESIHTSLDLGEDVQAATKRLQSVIRNPKRAALIAHQETVQAYATGIHEFGAISGAIGKQWTDNGAIDICKANTEAGPIPFDKAYPSGDQHPTAHIGCKCYERVIYQNELDANPDLFG